MLMRDKLFYTIKLAVLLPIFIVVTTLWMPFMIVIKLWKESAKDVNKLFEADKSG